MRRTTFFSVIVVVIAVGVIVLAFHWYREAVNYERLSHGLPMMSSSSWYGLARDCRMRAAKARAHADEMKEIEPKAILLRIADDYEKLAEWAEKFNTVLAHKKPSFSEQVRGAKDRGQMAKLSELLKSQPHWR